MVTSNRDMLLRTATEEVYVHGMGGARVDRIARAAGLNKRLIYHYFGDKDGLCRAVVAAQFGRLRNVLGLSDATRRFLTHFPHDDPTALEELPVEMSAAIVVRELPQAADRASGLSAEEWATVCLELLSRAMPRAAHDALGAAPGSREFSERCGRLFSRPKPRYRVTAGVRP